MEIQKISGFSVRSGQLPSVFTVGFLAVLSRSLGLQRGVFAGFLLRLGGLRWLVQAWEGEVRDLVHRRRSSQVLKVNQWNCAFVRHPCFCKAKAGYSTINDNQIFNPGRWSILHVDFSFPMATPIGVGQGGKLQVSTL